MDLEQRFKIGDPVEVSSTYRYGEWVDVPLWIVGIDLHGSGICYTVVEQWPPVFHNRHDGGADGQTDGFYDADLHHRSKQAEAPK